MSKPTADSAVANRIAVAAGSRLAILEIFVPSAMAALDSQGEDQFHVDREIHIERLKRELEELAGGAMISGGPEQVSSELEEAFLERVCEIKKAPWQTTFDRLVQHGISVTPPAELDDGSLSVKLQEIIEALAAIRCFLENTDHLSDRELYNWLWTEALREETPDLAQLGGAWHVSPIGSGNEEDMMIFLRYYASNKERYRWKQEFPNDLLPPHCRLPYERDRNLPRPRED